MEFDTEAKSFILVYQFVYIFLLDKYGNDTDGWLFFPDSEFVRYVTITGGWGIGLWIGREFYLFLGHRILSSTRELLLTVSCVTPIIASQPLLGKVKATMSYSVTLQQRNYAESSHVKTQLSYSLWKMNI